MLFITMGTKGAFGYIIGRKKRIMRVQYDADLLWQILVREIYILMKHFNTKEALQEAFEKIKTTKTPPKKSDIHKYKMFSNTEDNNNNNEWHSLLHYCQSSYINILEAGIIINEPNDEGIIFMLDFNKGCVIYYNKEFNGTIQELGSATIEEIMEFEEMPTKTYTEIVGEMKEQHNAYYSNLTKIEREIEKITFVIDDAKKQCSYNIIDRAGKMLDIVNNEKQKLHLERRVFYHRLKALDLIENECENV